MNNQARFIYASSEACADLFWATRFYVPDPIPFILQGKKKTLIASDLEYSRAKKEAEVDEVLPFSHYVKKLQANGKNGIRDIDVLDSVFREKKIRRLEVPSNFPYRTATELAKRGYQLTPILDPFFPEREFKTKTEKKNIVAAIRATEEAIRAAWEIIRQSSVKNGKLSWQGSLLTSERLRSFMEQKMLELGCLGQHTIIAGGKQAADPHCRGSGPLFAKQPIVMDVFPKSIATGYYADITRTVFKGRPNDRIFKMYEAVRKAQAKGFALIRDGVAASRVHEGVSKVMEDLGFKTGLKNGKPEGFIHGTGHGLGLEIHESPRVGKNLNILKKGQVVTVEPGLYYENLGGIRIEDDVYVTKTGCELLSKLPRTLQVL